MKRVKACIRLYVMYKKILNTKIGKVKHDEYTLLLELISFDLKLL